MSTKSIILTSIMLLFLQSCKEKDAGEVTGYPALNSRVILTGYEIIWGMDFLPDGDLLFTEKRGKVYRKTNEAVTEITGFPPVLDSRQGGLLDIRVHPDYAENGWIYASYSASSDSGGMLRLIRFNISGNKISNIQNIFSTDGSNTWGGHYGSRIEFDIEGYLYLSIGEGGDQTYGGPKTKNNNAQDLTSAWGKIHRLKDDGSIPEDNPVFPGMSGPSSIYSYGHRNPQGLAVHPENNQLWSTEHGPRGGDEINIINKGANYGWPAYSIGVNYDGTRISIGHSAAGITEPVYTWTPSIGVCGMAFITSNKPGSWKGNLLVSGLVSEKLHRCVVSGNTITEEEVLLSNSGRVRDVIEAPDGSIYVSVENPGRIIQISPE